MDPFARRLFLSVAGAAIALVGAVVGAWFGYSSANRAMDVKMVEIAVGILSQEPKDNIAPAREWAVDVISRYADVKPSKEVREALVNYKAIDYGTGYTRSGGSDASYHSGGSDTSSAQTK